MDSIVSFFQATMMLLHNFQHNCIPSIGIKPDNGARCAQTKLFDYFFKCPFYCVNNPMPLFKVSNIYSASAEYIRIQENP